MLPEKCETVFGKEARQNNDFIPKRMTFDSWSVWATFAECVLAKARAAFERKQS